MHRNLCTVVHGPFPLGEPRVARQVKVALDEGYDVEVVAMRQPGEAACEHVAGARVLRLPIAHKRGRGLLGVLFEYAGFTALATLRVGLRAFRHRYSAVQINNPPDFLMAAAIAPKLLGARIIFDVHDLSPDMFAMRFEGRPGAVVADRALRAIERWAARLADVVITVHEPYRRELGRRGVPADKIAVVMNTLDEALLPAGPAAIPAPSGFRFVYHGTVTPHYGVHLLVEAASLLRDEIPDLRVDVYGDGDAVAALRERAAQLGLEDAVAVSGDYLPQRDVLARVRSANVGVIPNLPIGLNRFALSSKLFEYVALGVPVVSADLPTIRAHFSDDEVAYFEPGNAASLAEALRAVHRDPAAAAARAGAARRRYEAYRWPLSARRYASALRGEALLTEVAEDPLYAETEWQIAALQAHVDAFLESRSPARVLEAGCGSASYLRVPDGTHVTGIDISAKQLERNTTLEEKILGDVQTYRFESEEYDAIVSWDVLEHLPRPEQALANLASALRPGGIFVLALPNVLSLKGLVTKLTPHAFHVWVYRKFFGWKMAGGDDHGPFRTYLRLSTAPERLKALAARNGLAVEYFSAYESWSQRQIRERFRLTGRAWAALDEGVRRLTRGTVTPALTDYIVVFRKP